VRKIPQEGKEGSRPLGKSIETKSNAGGKITAVVVYAVVFVLVAILVLYLSRQTSQTYMINNL